MASVSNVRLEIFEQQGSALVRASFTVQATLHDAPHQQSYRELVQLVGVDEGIGEDGTNELLANGTISDDVISFSTSAVAIVRIRERTVPIAVLDEDPGIIPRRDELRARVTLIPLPPGPVVRESNLVTRGGPVINRG